MPCWYGIEYKTPCVDSTYWFVRYTSKGKTWLLVNCYVKGLWVLISMDLHRSWSAWLELEVLHIPRRQHNIKIFYVQKINIFLWLYHISLVLNRILLLEWNSRKKCNDKNRRHFIQRSISYIFMWHGIDQKNIHIYSAVVLLL